MEERKLTVMPGNHLYYMEGSSSIKTREIRAVLFTGGLRDGYDFKELYREVERLAPLENSLVMKFGRMDNHDKR